MPLSPDDREALEETLELLSDGDALREIEQGRREIARGESVTAEKLRDRYLPR